MLGQALIFQGLTWLLKVRVQNKILTRSHCSGSTKHCSEWKQHTFLQNLHWILSRFVGIFVCFQLELLVSGIYKVKVPEVVFPGVFLAREVMGYFNGQPNKALDFNASNFIGHKETKPYPHSEGAIWYYLFSEMQLKSLLALGE